MERENKWHASSLHQVKWIKQSWCLCTPLAPPAVTLTWNGYKITQLHTRPQPHPQRLPLILILTPSFHSFPLSLYLPRIRILQKKKTIRGTKNRKNRGTTDSLQVYSDIRKEQCVPLFILLTGTIIFPFVFSLFLSLATDDKSVLKLYG